MTDVACVNWGKKYPVEYTFRLFNMVKRNTTKDFKFYCLTDDVTRYDKFPNIHAVELDTDDTGWWCKFQLYNPGVLPNGEYLYLDLDVVVVDNIDCFFEHPSFGITRDFIRPNKGLLPGKEYNSSVVRFDNRRTEGLYKYYLQNKRQWLDYQKQIHFFGDQNVTSAYLNYYPDFLNVFPDEWLWSFKKGQHRGKTAGDRSQWFGRTVPEGGKVCVFHGDPNPTEVLDVDWIASNYR